MYFFFILQERFFNASSLKRNVMGLYSNIDPIVLVANFVFNKEV